MRFTALVQASGLRDVDSRAPLTFTDVSCRFGLVFFCFCFSREDEEDESGWCCHNLRTVLSFSVAIPLRISRFLRTLESHLRVCECFQSKLMLRTRFHLLHLMEEWHWCAIWGWMTHNHLDPEDTDIAMFKNIITVFMHSCKGCIANMKCNMFYMWKGEVMLTCLSQRGESESWVHP